MNKRWIALLGMFATAAFADTLTMRDGRTVDGTYAGGDTRSVRMVVGDRVQTFNIDRVVSLTFGAPAAAGGYYQQDSAPPQAPPPQPPPPDNSGLQSNRPYEQTDPNLAGLQIPASTPVVVRMIDKVDSETDRVGQTFRASVDEPVYVNGQIVIQRGADAVVKLVAQQQSGKLTGRTALTLALQQVNINGRLVDTYTESVTQASGSRGKRTAAAVGGGAALGAIIGGLAGGGRGAAIGATSGGAIGAGAEVFTAGQRVKIPSETRLTFTLQSPVQI